MLRKTPCRGNSSGESELLKYLYSLSKQVVASTKSQNYLENHLQMTVTVMVTVVMLMIMSLVIVVSETFLFVAVTMSCTVPITITVI